MCPGMVASRSSITRAMRLEGRRGDRGTQGKRVAVAQCSVRCLMERRGAAARPVNAGQAATQTGRQGAGRQAVVPHWGFEEGACLDYWLA